MSAAASHVHPFSLSPSPNHFMPLLLTLVDVLVERDRLSVCLGSEHGVGAQRSVGVAQQAREARQHSDGRKATHQLAREILGTRVERPVRTKKTRVLSLESHEQKSRTAAKGRSEGWKSVSAEPRGGGRVHRSASRSLAAPLRARSVSSACSLCLPVPVCPALCLCCAVSFV